MTKLDANIINSFPSTKRASVNKLLTENSITRLINRLVDVEGFVITTGIDADFLNDIPIGEWNNVGADFEFVIRGYYFSVAKDTAPSGLAKLLDVTGFKNFDDEINHTLFAGIFIDVTDKDFPELYGQDNVSGQYQAISFYNDTEDKPTPPSEPDKFYKFYELPLVQYKQQEDGSWGKVVALDSLFKFKSISIADIDGGEISL